LGINITRYFLHKQPIKNRCQLATVLILFQLITKESDPAPATYTENILAPLIILITSQVITTRLLLIKIISHHDHKINKLILN